MKLAINKDNGEFHLSKIWEPITHKLKTHKKTHPFPKRPTSLRSTRTAAINAFIKIQAMGQQ